MSVINGPRIIPPAGSSSMLSNMAGKAGNMATSAIGGAIVGEIEDLLGVRFDPAPAYLFYVSISGLVVGLFTGCDGLSVTRQVEELREGGVNDHVHHLPGGVSLGKITLKRGLSISRVLWDWFNDGLYNCKVKRVNMSITQGAPGMNSLTAASSSGAGIVKTWNLEGAFPESWTLSSLDVNNTSQVAIESVEIVCHSISLSPVAGTPMSPSALF
jgi:phage tail-like protein